MEAQFTWREVVSIWWAWLWRSAVGGFAMGFVFGMTTGFIGSMFGYQAEAIVTFVQIVGSVLGMAVGLYFMKTVLEKEYKSFRIRIERK